MNFNGKDTSETTAKFDASGKLKGPVTVSFLESDLDSDGYSPSLVVHEGDHVNEFKTNGNKRSKFNRELDAFTNQSVFLESVAPNSGGPYNIGNPKKDHFIWNPAWDGPDKETLRKTGLTEFLGVPKKDGGYYELSPPKPKVVRPTPKKRS